MKLTLFGLGCTRHAGQLVVHAEVVLDRDRGEGLRLAPDLDAFLRFHRLMQAVTPTASGHLPTGELIHDDDLSIFTDDVPLVLVEERVRLQELMEDMHLLALRRVFRLEFLDPVALFVNGEGL